MLLRRFSKCTISLVFLITSSYALSQFNYNNALEVTGCTAVCDKVLDILPYHNGQPVTRIGYEAFLNNDLIEVTIPETVTSIGTDAFSDNQLTFLEIPNSVTEIEIGAFDGNQLRNIIWGDSVVSIDNYSFIGNQLTNLELPDSVLYIGEDAFRENDLNTVTFGVNVDELKIKIPGSTSKYHV